MIEDSEMIFYSESTIFQENHATKSGGAIFISGESVFEVTSNAEVTFDSNLADDDGGAIATSAVTSSSLFSFFFDKSELIISGSSCLFRNNLAGRNGGALSILQGVSYSEPFGGGGSVFIGNSAGASGGAIYVSSPLGPTFRDCMFISNHANIGGALFSVSSGVEKTGDFFVPLEIRRCSFKKNVANISGGAIDSIAGRDLIIESNFKNNTAKVGGALRLSGTASSIINSKFVENVSGEESGSAILNLGFIDNMENNAFSNNIFSCETGEYIGYDDSIDLYDNVCNGCDTECIGCTIEGKTPICVETLDNTRSLGGTNGLNSLYILQGFWRSTNDSLNIYQCFNEDCLLYTSPSPRD